MKSLIRGAWGFFKKTVAMIIGYIFYDPKYLKGKYFNRYTYSQGWQWLMQTVFMQKIVGINRKIPFPVSFRATVVGWENIEFDKDNITIFQKAGNYYQATKAKIKIGKDCFIACNVGIITANHDVNDLSKHCDGKDVVIGAKSWIGMNSTILPGVVLGEQTIVGAGSVVTKSFPEGHCVIAGNPAKLIKKIGKEDENMKFPPDKKTCIGCGLCADICPKKCISMQVNDEGFLVPKIDKSECINCGSCDRKCPVIQPREEIKPITAYAVKDKDEASRLKSASGGASAVFAKYVLDNGGAYSAVKLDSDFSVVHDICDNAKDIDAFRDSKYVQSDMTGIYKKISDELAKGKKVFATGTPCQVAAIRSKFGYGNDNLILCDLVCQGVPSPLVLKKYVEYAEQAVGKKMTHFYFRDKTNGWQKSNTKMVFADGFEKVVVRSESEFFSIFANNISMRECCFKCNFREFNIYSDITIGDYWGIDKKYPEFNDDKGCSLVMINTEKGEKFFNEVSQNIDFIETGVDFAVETHPKLLKSVAVNPLRENFFAKFNKDISPKEFKKIVEEFTGSGIINRVKRKIILSLK